MKLTADEKRYVEGYAAALQELELSLTGENGCNKHYDPMTIEGGTMHSYAFDMLDGGRHHPTGDYRDLAHIKEVLMNETTQSIVEERRIEPTDKEIHAENEGRKKLINSLQGQMVKALEEIQRLKDEVKNKLK